MAVAPDGRIFVCEQAGQLRVIKNGALLSTPFLTVTVDSAGERGLLGVAFDPALRRRTASSTSTTRRPRRRRTTASAASPRRHDGDVAVPGSEVVLLDLTTSASATNHNGGAIHFGADGKLYVAVGENANSANAQTLTNLLGRSCASTPTARSRPTTRSTRPPRGKNRAIWALGLRNPFTFAFQPGTGRIFINDVGREHLGGDQRRARRRQLRLADDRGRDLGSATSRRRSSPTATARGTTAARSPAARSTTRSRAVSRGLRRRLLLRRLLRGLDPTTRRGSGYTAASDFATGIL